MPDTEALLADWKAKTDAATEGPWEIHISPGDHERPSALRAYRVTTADAVGLVARDALDDNALFMIAARTAMPKLLAAVEAIRALIAEHERIEFHNDTVPLNRISDLEREPTSEDYRRALDAALSGSEPDERNER